MLSHYPPSPLNILLTNSTDIFAGGEDYVLILARYLARRGHAVFVSANPGHLLLQKSEESGLTTVPVSYTGMNRVFAVGSELRASLRSYHIDIVHSNANYDRTAAALATIRTPVHHVAGVHSSHSIQHNITHWIRNRYGTAHFVADADSVRDVLIREDHIAPDRITIIPIGVEPGKGPEYETWRRQVRKELGADERTIVIGNVGRLVAFKGQRVLLDAAANIAAKRQDFLVAIVGDGELSAQLLDQAQRLGLEQRVRFLGFRDDLEKLYTGFDIYCHSSLEMAEEAFPLAILRALAEGLPVVCTNVGGIAAMVADGRSGFLKPPDDPDALAEGLLACLNDPALRSSMGAASRALFDNHYHANIMAERMEKVYEKVLGA